jgi:hypothetical protein
MRLPTSATDLRHEHPSTTARFPSPQLAPRRPPPAALPTLSRWNAPEHGAGPPFGNPTPGEQAFDDAAQLRPARSLASFTLCNECTSRQSASALPWSRRYQPCPGRASRSSDAPCRPPEPGCPGVEKTRTASTDPSSKGTASPARSAFRRQIPPLVYVKRSRTAAEHRARSLAAGEPASGPLSPSPMRPRGAY